ncbi:MAG: glycosyl hydrolase family protein, partial [Actinobacteria bacterium]|nr:glycosyl hydrolase family protein [Actinomycetota bacterium]
DLDAARRIDGQFNRWFLDPLFRGEYPADIIKDFRDTDAEAVVRWQAAVQPGDLDVISTPIDTLGVNYYHGEFVGGTPPEVDPPAGDAPTPRPIGKPFPAHEDLYWHDRGLPRTNMGWEVQPEGLTRLLERVSEEYSAAAGVALYVTENGASYDDEPVVDEGETRVHDDARLEFVQAHLAAVLDAVDKGVDVRGYFYWSLMDNFEWAWGYAKRFGIVYVDYETQERTVKDSGREYARIIAERALVPVPAR